MMVNKSGSPSEAAEVILFTDGACRGNPGPGGWAFIMRHSKTGRELRRSGGLAETTNNQMELTAVIEGLSCLKRSTKVEIVSDSTYVLNGLSSWIDSWKRAGWKRKGGPLKNIELWQKLDELRAFHSLQFQWIRGHDGHPENEVCDEMAVKESHAF